MKMTNINGLVFLWRSPSIPHNPVTHVTSSIVTTHSLSLSQNQNLIVTAWYENYVVEQMVFNGPISHAQTLEIEQWLRAKYGLDEYGAEAVRTWAKGILEERQSSPPDAALDIEPAASS